MFGFTRSPEDLTPDIYIYRERERELTESDPDLNAECHDLALPPFSGHCENAV